MSFRVRKKSSSGRSLVSVIYRFDTKHFHAILYAISQPTGDTLNTPKDWIFESYTHLAIVPATDSSGNGHGVSAQCICCYPGLIEYLLRDVVFSLILVCASTCRLNIRPKEGEEKEDLEHSHCYQTMEYRWIFFLLRDLIVMRSTLDNNPIDRLLRWHHVRWHSSLKP
jgi:hypothetical protein